MTDEKARRGGLSKPEMIALAQDCASASASSKGTGPVIINYSATTKAAPLDPCLLGRHRPAWLTSGRVACGRCGAPL